MNDKNRWPGRFRRLLKAVIDVVVTTLVVGALGWMGAHYAGYADEAFCKFKKFWHPSGPYRC